MGRSRLSRSPSSSDRAPPDFYVTTERLRNFTDWGRNNDATFVFSREISSVSRRGFPVLICFKAVSNRMSHAVWWLATFFSTLQLVLVIYCVNIRSFITKSIYLSRNKGGLVG